MKKKTKVPKKSTPAQRKARQARVAKTKRAIERADDTEIREKGLP